MILPHLISRERNKPTAFMDEIHSKKVVWYKDEMFWATVILMVALLVGIGWGILTAPAKEIKSDLDLLPPQVVEQVINGEFK